MEVIKKLLEKNMKIVKPSVELLWITPNPEIQIEIAGRTCYKSEDKITKDSASKFVEKMRKSGHHAMLEHAVASFRIVTSRAIANEITRHRLASLAQNSTRYINYASKKFNHECSFIEPPDLTVEQRQYWKQACIDSETSYFKMIEAGSLPQIARSVLLNCLQTELVMMANLREWRHFIKLRGSKAAHPQIRPIANSILMTLMLHAPNVFNDLWVDMLEEH